MTPPYLNWSQERGFYYDPDGQYVRRSDAAVLLAKLDACTEAHALTAQRAEQAEQQLTAARLDAEEQLSLKNAHLVQANEVGRAQVLAQVTQAFKLHWEDGAQPQAFLDTLIHLQPDASMAVLSVADREQALGKITEAARMGYAMHSMMPHHEIDAAALMAEARSLLHLPQEPK